MKKDKPISIALRLEWLRKSIEERGDTTINLAENVVSACSNRAEKINRTCEIQCADLEVIVGHIIDLERKLLSIR